MRSPKQNLIFRMVGCRFFFISSFFSGSFLCSSGTFICLSKSFFLGVEDYGQVLYVRPCYLALFNKVQAAWSSRKRVGVFGTPGIGKTFFLIYTFLRLVQVRIYREEGREGEETAVSKSSIFCGFLFYRSGEANCQLFDLIW
jgi:hypothetical protein